MPRTLTIHIIIAALLIWGMPGFALAQTIQNIKIHGNEVSFDMGTSSKKHDAPTIFALDGSKPRVVVDFSKATIGLAGETSGSGEHVIQGDVGIKRIRLAERGKSDVRAVIDLEEGVTLGGHSQEGQYLKIALNGIEPARSEISARKISVPVPETRKSRIFDNEIPFPRLQPLLSTRRKAKPVIVIDPGHGGRDPGAIGSGGTQEKSITSKSAKELQRQLIATGRYTVIITRKTDKYLEHEERLRIARAGNADLFISIHADSTKGKTARGASVYTLAGRAKTRSKKIVDSQNWIMDVDLSQQTDPVGDILVDLAQRKTETQSELFADHLIAKLGKSTHLIGNSHRRAGYFVLLAPDVPAVLLEMGFLSNPQDEKLLNSSAHRKKVLKSVTLAINAYFDEQVQ